MAGTNANAIRLAFLPHFNRRGWLPFVLSAVPAHATTSHSRAPHQNHRQLSWLAWNGAVPDILHSTTLGEKLVSVFLPNPHLVLYSTLTSR